MLGLSNDIEFAIDSIIEGLEYDIDISEITADKFDAAMKSKIESFRSAKQMILRWQNNQNSPNESKLKVYVQRLVNAGDKSLITLRSALREKIDFSSIDATKHHLAVKAKASIHTAIVEIDSALIELRLQLSSENFNLSDREFKVGFPEKYSKGEFYPKSHYYKNWFDSKNDSIVIDPKGTKGEIIVLDSLNITLPEVPKNKKDILFSNEKKANQYWRRTPMHFGLSVDSVDAYTEYILEEFRRRREGIWFMNNGKPVYLTGNHYFALQWCKMEDSGGYMNFRYAQLNMFYHTESCVIDQRCIGQFFVKSRRTGYTYEKVCRFLEEATSNNNANFGITSKSDEDAKKAFSKFSYAYLNLPFFFRPVVRGKEDSKVFLEFAKPSNMSKEAKKKRDTQTDDYLNTKIDYQPTNEGSYDGQKMFRYLADEASKWTKGRNFQSHWGQVSPTMDEGGTIVGKAFVGSTVAAMKDGGFEFRELYYQSLIKKRDMITTRTPSGLYSYFLPGHKNMSEFTDKYGVCHEDLEKGQSFINADGVEKKTGSIRYLEARRASKRKESDIAYNDELRAFPMTVEEAFRDELDNALFNIERINEQMSFNMNNDVDKTLVRGDFGWKDGVRDTRVVWTPNSKGKFLINWIPELSLQNQYEMKAGWGGYSYAPLNDDIGAFGCDPYDISGVVDGKAKRSTKDNDNTGGSKGALSGVTSFTLKNAPSNSFFLEYISRTQTAEIFFEDVLMACVFYGMPILVENNKPRLLYHFKNRGYRNFAITRFDKAVNRLSVTEREIGGMPNSSEDVIQMHSSAIESYINKNVGVVNDEGEIGSMPFNKTLQDWLEFDIRKRGSYDLGISSGLALMAINRHAYRPQVERKPITINLHKYA
jgi:hypothetical protein